MSPKESPTDLSTFMDRLKPHDYFHDASFSQLIEDTSEDVAFRMLARFHQSLGESVTIINEGVKSQQGELVWRATHKVAGTAELLGFRDLGKDSKEITQSLRASPDTEAHGEEIKTYLHSAEEIYSAILTACPNLSYYL